MARGSAAPRAAGRGGTAPLDPATGSSLDDPGPRVGDRTGHEVDRHECRRDHETVAQVRRRHLHPGESAEREPPETPGPSLARRYPAAATSRTVVHASAPRTASRSRSSTSTSSSRDETASRSPRRAGCDSFRRNAYIAETGEQRVAHDEQPQRQPRGEHREQPHREEVEPPALWVGGETIARHLERVPQRHSVRRRPIPRGTTIEGART